VSDAAALQSSAATVLREFTKQPAHEESPGAAEPDEFPQHPKLRHDAISRWSALLQREARQHCEACMSRALYDDIGKTYTSTRQSDPRIAAAIWHALGDAARVLNVGAGTDGG
jgi:hypothetical protein